jgi:transposase
MCLGRCACKGNVSVSAVLPSQGATGPKKAAIAVAASILTAAYHMLKDGTLYQDLGPDYLVKRDASRTVVKLARRIKDLGFEVHYRATA